MLEKKACVWYNMRGITQSIENTIIDFNIDMSQKNRKINL